MCLYVHGNTAMHTHTTSAFIFRNIFDCHPDATAMRYHTMMMIMMAMKDGTQTPRRGKMDPLGNDDS